MALPPPEVARQFARLRAHFRAGLGARQAEIDAAQAAGAAPPQALILALHRLAGAAASFGFATLGAAAKSAERAARAAPGPAREAHLRQALDELRAALTEAQAPPPAPE